ncbi:NAD(P)-dependent oxidoreductase [Candidatus Poribacteria bacterium]|jgi:UDP-glucose 4-epimerase|nr:NAD(P)-dependent oxidoreductase [Candidatus Poribacteria bacterium]MBT5535442.1 NAD(P)-dependent oxidoreductase [Candidatus Poribacteria bacterium]MBT7097975.1 NAD(P)-dependent oxidoreductase [Candidatus Poribacteria bacterium]MBT7807701.1 NAD(P)-dependent oxidoreductase [Candidatus Poribacteria bacterium]
MQTIAVTGATGRLGANLVSALLDRGYAVRGMVIPDDPKRGKMDPFDVEIVVGDIRDASVCSRFLDGVDAVVHTANLVGVPSGMDRDTFFDINVKGTLAIAEAAAERADSLQRFVHVSSDAVYPMGNHDSRPDYAPIDEDHPKRPAGLYALTKALNEQTVESYRASHGLQTTMVRPAGMFAGAEVLGRWTVGFALGLLRGAVGNPNCGIHHPDLAQAIATMEADASPDDLCAIRDGEGRPWLYSPADARDVAHACVCALERPEAVGEAFNAAIPQPFAFDDVAEYLSQRTGAPVYECVVPTRWVYWSDIRKARALIGYAPQGTLERVFDTALAHKAGEATDVIPA